VTQTLSWRAAIVAFVVGVMGVQQLAQLPQAYWLWGMPLLASVWALPRQGGWRVVRLTVLLLCWVALGVAWATWRADLRLADNLPATWAGVPIVVSGVVSDLPVRTDRGQHFEFDVERVLTPGAQVPSSIQLSLYSTKGTGVSAAPPIQVGQRWQWTVRLNRPHASQNPHVMDMESVWFANDVRAMGVVETRPPPQLLAAWVNSPMNRINLMREDISQRIDRELPNQPYAGVLKALTVGDQSAIPAGGYQMKVEMNLSASSHQC
jgi:competence protein ComEC